MYIYIYIYNNLSLEIHKSPVYDNISFNVLKKYFRSLREPLKYLFNLSIEKGIFLDFQRQTIKAI